MTYGPLRARSPQNYIGNGDGTSFTDWWTTTPNTKFRTMEYQAYPYTKVNNMDQGRNHLMILWQKLDTEVRIIRSGQAGVDVEWNKARATTFAEVIAQLMSPFYADTNAVLAESMVRWTAAEEMREHQSPGLAEHYWDPTKRDGAPLAGVSQTKRTITPAPLDEQKTKFVKHALEQGSMKPEELASMFGVSIEVIKAAVDGD